MPSTAEKPSAAEELWSLYDDVPTVLQAVETMYHTEWKSPSPPAPQDADGFWRGNFYFDPTDVGFVVTARSGLTDMAPAAYHLADHKPVCDAASLTRR